MRIVSKICFLLLLFPAALSAQHQLELRVEGVSSSQGIIQVAVYSQKEHFLKVEGVYRSDSANALEGTTSLTLDDLPGGEYAVAVFHDLNSNDELDKNWMGIPREPLGFSNARMRTFGPPSFEECLVRLPTSAPLVIALE